MKLKFSLHGWKFRKFFSFNRGSITASIYPSWIRGRRQKSKMWKSAIQCSLLFLFKFSFESKLIPQFQFISFIQIFFVCIAPALTESLAYSLSHSRHCLHNRWRSAKSFFFFLLWVLFFCCCCRSSRVLTSDEQKKIFCDYKFFLTFYFIYFEIFYSFYSMNIKNYPPLPFGH